MNVKCFFGFHDYHGVGKCYAINDLGVSSVESKYITIKPDGNISQLFLFAVLECKKCHKIKLKQISARSWYTYGSATKAIEQFKADGWISYEDLVLTKGAYL